MRIFYYLSYFDEKGFIFYFIINEEFFLDLLFSPVIMGIHFLNFLYGINIPNSLNFVDNT